MQQPGTPPVCPEQAKAGRTILTASCRIKVTRLDPLVTSVASSIGGTALMVFDRLLWAAMVVGVIAGLLYTSVQHVQVIPLIQIAQA